MAKNKKSVKKGLMIGISSVVILLAAAYAGIGYYFHDHFYPGTVINDTNFSLGTADAADEKIKEEAEDYLLAIHDRDDRVSYISGSDIDYHYESDGSVQKVMEEQNSMLWPLYIGKEHSYTVEVKLTYDESKLVKLVEAMDCFKEENIEKPENAYLKYTDEGYEIVPEKKGNQPLEEQIMLDVKEAIANRQAVLQLNDEDYVQPTVTSEDSQLQEKLQVTEKYKNMSITYEIEGSEQVLDGLTILSWLTINDDLSVTVDPDMAASYAQQLASKYNTYAATRSFETTNGDTIKIGGGDYGWIIDKKCEAGQIIEECETGGSVTREPKYEQRAFVEGADDIGNTYIEIDYTNQHLWYYKDGSLVVDSDLVSGNLNNGNGSPDGVFKIISRQSPATLVGEDYESDVTYFMPFAYNVGLHDASWRSDFGGSIYKNSGSHGCINLPYEAADTIYKTVELGTPVVAYYRDSVQLTSNNARVSNAYSYSSK